MNATVIGPTDCECIGLNYDTFVTTTKQAGQPELA